MTILFFRISLWKILPFPLHTGHRLSAWSAEAAGSGAVVLAGAAAGEEAFGVSLGLQIKKGQGPAYDYLHLHYRGAPIATAMGAEPIDQIRQMRATALDRYSGGRQFVEHFAIPEWNIVPVTPTSVGGGLTA